VSTVRHALPHQRISHTCIAVHHAVGTYKKGRVKKNPGTSHLCTNSVNIISISSSEEGTCSILLPTRNPQRRESIEKVSSQSTAATSSRHRNPSRRDLVVFEACRGGRLSFGHFLKVTHGFLLSRLHICILTTSPVLQERGSMCWLF
jgi:hypothetical protein